MAVSAVHRPADRRELAELLRAATADGRPGARLRIAGGGTHAPPAPPGGPAARLDTTALDRIVDHTPADLTVTVEGGARAADLAALLAREGQCWPQADIAPGATVGGILAAAASGHRRLRDGPVRDSLLEVVVATGDGRLVTGGGRTVKNVSGFDIPRLMVGAHGTLGVIVQATLKLWPRPAREGWFRRPGRPADLAATARALVASPARPGAVVVGPRALHVELVGPADDVVAPDGFAAAVGPPPEPGAAEPVGAILVRASVPPSRLPVLVATLDEEGRDFRAWMGVGLCDVAVADDRALAEVREAARRLGGHATVRRDPAGRAADPWGAPPAGLAQARRLRRAFDPAGVLNHGVLPGVDGAPAAPAAA